MGLTIAHHDFSSMCIHDGFAQRQTQSHTAAAVGNLIGCTVKHVKNMGLCLVRNSGAIVCHRDVNKLSLLLPPNFDIRPGRGVLHGIVKDIDEDLDNQLCIYLCQEIIVTALHMKVVFRTLAIDVPKRLCYHLVDELGGHVQVHPPLFQSAD